MAVVSTLLSRLTLCKLLEDLLESVPEFIQLSSEDSVWAMLFFQDWSMHMNLELILLARCLEIAEGGFYMHMQ